MFDIRCENTIAPSAGNNNPDGVTAAVGFPAHCADANYFSCTVCPNDIHCCFYWPERWSD